MTSAILAATSTILLVLLRLLILLLLLLLCCMAVDFCWTHVVSTAGVPRPWLVLLTCMTTHADLYVYSCYGLLTRLASDEQKWFRLLVYPTLLQWSLGYTKSRKKLGKLLWSLEQLTDVWAEGVDPLRVLTPTWS